MVRGRALLALVTAALAIAAGCAQPGTGSTSDTVALGDDSTEQGLLQNDLETDSDFQSLTNAAPLINDGGAVFLDQPQAQSLSVLSLPQAQGLTALSLPQAHVRRFDVARVAGKLKVQVTCGSPGAYDAAFPAGTLTLCFDRTTRRANVILAHHVQGKFAIDLPPYDPDFTATGVLPSSGSFGIKPMDLLFTTHARFRKTRVRWVLDGISGIRESLVTPNATHNIHIGWLDVTSGGATLLHVTNPDAIASRSALVTIPRAQTVTVTAKVTGEPAFVTVQGPDGRTLRLFDDGSHGDAMPSDQIYTGQYVTPAEARPVHHIVLQAIADHTLSNEDQDDFDSSAWIVPVQVN